KPGLSPGRSSPPTLPASSRNWSSANEVVALRDSTAAQLQGKEISCQTQSHHYLYRLISKYDLVTCGNVPGDGASAGACWYTGRSSWPSPYHHRDAGDYGGDVLLRSHSSSIQKSQGARSNAQNR